MRACVHVHVCAFVHVRMGAPSIFPLLQWRYTEWVRFNRTTATPDWTDVWGVELYNHSRPTVDFNDENYNYGNDRGYEGVIAQMKELLRAGWRHAIPDLSWQV